MARLEMQEYCTVEKMYQLNIRRRHSRNGGGRKLCRSAYVFYDGITGKKKYNTEYEYVCWNGNYSTSFECCVW